MEDVETELVVVYTRVCGAGDPSDNSREMRFRVPAGIPQRDLLEGGFALDGNMATQSVEPVGDWTMSDSLRVAQLELLAWLAARGYDEVEFK